MHVRPCSHPPLASLLAGLVLATPAALSALGTQEPVQPQAQEKVQTLPPASVEVVRIDVVATEKRRARAGLRREDFVVLEDGKPQPIVQFQAFTRPLPGTPSATPAAEASAEPAGQEPEKEALLPARYVVLAIDDVHMGFESLVRAKKALARFIGQDLGQEDQVALVTTSGSGAISQEFSADHAVLRQTLSRVSVQERRAGWSGVPYLSEYQAELIEAGDPTALDAAVQEILASGIEQDPTAAASIAQQKARAITEEAVYNTRLVLEALESLCRGLSGVSGRKAVFLFSDGFLTGMTTNRASSGFDVRRIADAATRAAVVIYSLDTRGLIASPPVGSASSLTRITPQTFGNIDAMRHRAEEATRDSMNALAADTGGFMTENSNDLRSALHEMLKDTETYYVLAYEPANTRRDGSFRKIEVRLPGVKGVRLRTRSGYFAPDDSRRSLAAASVQDEARRSEQRRAEMTTALHSLAPLDGIPVRVSADFVGLENGATQLVVSGNVDVTKLPFVRLPDKRQATLESVAVAFDEEGARVATLPTERTAMNLNDADYERVLKTGIPYEKAVALKPGRYQVRLAVREDATGLLGSAWQWIDIPEIVPGRFTLSSLFLLQEADKTAPVAAPASDAGAAVPDLHPAQALRRYRRGESLYAQIYAYNPKQDVDGATRLFAQAEILKGGRTLGKAAPEPMDSGGPQGPPVPHTSRIKLQRFEPGDYELRMTVSDQNANAMVSRRVAFTVVD